MSSELDWKLMLNSISSSRVVRATESHRNFTGGNVTFVKILLCGPRQPTIAHSFEGPSIWTPLPRVTAIAAGGGRDNVVVTMSETGYRDETNGESPYRHCLGLYFSLPGISCLIW